MKILSGKKVLLKPMNEFDLNYLMDIYEQEGNKKLYGLNLGNRDETIIHLVDLLDQGIFQGWVTYTKQGKASKKVGTIFLTDEKSHLIRVNGAADKQFLKGLAKRLKINDEKFKTYTQESLELVINYCFHELKKERVEANIEYENKLAIQLVRKSGFKKEGILRKFIRDGDQYKDLVMFSILKEDWKNGKDN